MRNQFKNNIASNKIKYIKRDITMKYFSNISNNKRELEEKIKEILEEEMNKECFDCGSLNPKYISINNGIFLCNNCIKVHEQFTKDISLIKNNDLFSLTNKEILFIYFGGNSRLNNFVNYEYPGLQNYQPNILYRTQAMNYYRNRLNALVCKRKKPEKPNSIYAYKLIGEIIDKYSKNRLLFDTSAFNNKSNINNINNTNNTNNINNTNNTNNTNNLNQTNKIGKNLKYIYNNFNIKKYHYPRKITEFNFESSYQNNNINNTFNININQKENQKNRIVRRKKNLGNNNFDKNYNLYNNTFFEEMKNIFRQTSKKVKLRMQLNDKEDEERKTNYLKDDLMTHQASISNTIYFPNNNSFNNANNSTNTLFKKINIHKFTSLKHFDKNKDLSINNDFIQIYSRPRMSNNSFSKNYTITKNSNNENYNFIKKRNSIINGISKFSLKKLSLTGKPPINIIRRENKSKDYFSKKQNYYTKSNTISHIDKNNLSMPRNKIIIQLSNSASKFEDKIKKRELSFNNHHGKTYLNLNNHYKLNNNDSEENIDNKYKCKNNKRIFQKLNDNNCYSMIAVNKNENIENKKIINKNKDENNNINFIKVIKTTIGKRNNSDIHLTENFNYKNSYINNEMNNKIKNKIYNLNSNDYKNNIFLNKNENENKRILKAKKDKKEQEKIEKEDIKQLLLDGNYLFKKKIDLNILYKYNNDNDNDNEISNNDNNNNSDNNNIVNNNLNQKKNYLNNNNEEIINGGINNKNLNYKNNISKEQFNNNIIKIEINYDDNNSSIFNNKNNCTDLMNLSKEIPNKKIDNKQTIIPNEFLIEAKNIIKLYQTKNKNNDKRINNIIEQNNIKIGKDIKITYNIYKKRNKNSVSLNNSVNSIRNKYKQKMFLSHDNKNNNQYAKPEALNNNFIVNKYNIIEEEILKTNNKEIKNINISEDNWNINQIGEINLLNEINNIELD